MPGTKRKWTPHEPINAPESREPSKKEREEMTDEDIHRTLRDFQDPEQRDKFLSENKKKLKALIEKNRGEPLSFQICQSCYEVYTMQRLPKLLSCGHTICTVCCASNHGRGVVRCPFDRIHTPCLDIRTNEAITNYF